MANIVHHLKPGAVALISVMNLEFTERRTKHFFSVATEPDKLLTLKPSGTMEKTGNIFDHEYYMIDRDTKIVYRKEGTFEAGAALPGGVGDKRSSVQKDGDARRACRRGGLGRGVVALCSSRPELDEAGPAA